MNFMDIFRRECGIKYNQGVKDYSYVFNLMNLKIPISQQNSLRGIYLTHSQVLFFEEFASRNMFDNTIYPDFILEIIQSCINFKELKMVVRGTKKIWKIGDQILEEYVGENKLPKRIIYTLNYLNLGSIMNLLNDEEKENE